ncbi:transposase [Enterococcus sp. AZ150]
MTKYSIEFKSKIVQEYLREKAGLSYLSKKYSVKSQTQIGDWIKAYREFGKDGLLQKRQHQDYAFHFKLDAIELYQTTDLTYCEVAYHFSINKPALIAKWMRNFRIEGPDGLS